MVHRVARLYVLFFATAIAFGAQKPPANPRRQFTMKDSIEMTTFSDPFTRHPNAKGQCAPDGKHFLIVTTRGNLRTNQLESTLWDYSADTIERYLNEHAAFAPKPQRLFTIAGIPKAQQTDSYGSLITDAQWSTDSKAILFLAEQPDGDRHLFRIGLSGNTANDLTPGKVNVSGFSEAGGTIAYVVGEHIRPQRVVGKRINDASVDLTGLSLFQILSPKSFPDQSSLLPPLDLWVHYRGVNRKVNSDGKWYFPAAASELRIAVSPDGRGLIAARPVPDVPAGWLQYKTAENAYSFSLASTGTDPSGKQFTWPWQYIYINLESTKIVPLVDAPSGFIVGYADSLKAVWSADSTTVLFTNSYLPLRDTSGTFNVRNEVACAAAVYTIADRSSSCIAYARYPREFEWIDNATFGISAKEVVLHWKDKGNGNTEVYQKTQREWSFASKQPTRKVPQSGLSIYIRQDINEPPKLWASEQNTTEKELWDPNPQLASFDLGRASVYSWKDSTGYEWRGGLVLPPNFVQGHRYPLVIQTHGFSNEHEFLVDGSFTTGFAARPLAAAGIIVLQMGGRTDRKSGSPKDEAPSQVLGFKSAIDHLNQDGLIDTSRVGIIGFSRTAWYTEEALVLEPGLFHAATIIDGVDQSYMGYMLFAPDNPWGALDDEAANGGKPFGPEIQSWVQAAPGFNLYKVQCPVRIEAHGDLSVLQEWEIYSSLRQQGKPVDLVDMPDAQHILQQPQDRYASQQGDVDWFRFWLQGYKDPDPNKKDQYMRWDRLRRIK